ncbi:MAG: HEAT repeat domain-containing protein [Gemmatimonadales bacterium]|nr:HEAT repeat domain-containing protein [Gemmatimonadales bacterium]
MRRAAMFAGFLAFGVLPGQAQTLVQRAGTMGEGTIRFSYAAREGVCGREDGKVYVARSNDEWEGPCEAGPVLISASVSGGEVIRVRTYVGGRWKPGSGRVEDLGMIGVRTGTSWLEALAMAPGRIAGDAVFPITLADSMVTWEPLLRLAKATNAPSTTRQSALFWLGQVAGAAASAHLEEVAMSDDDRRLRDQAVFSLSQLRDNSGVPALLRLARTNEDPRVRKTAFFWLGQSKDPRALALFEEILTRP